MKIGTDIIEIDRIAHAIKRDHFLNKYFTTNEIMLIQKKGAPSAAANFAGKEAIAKAIGTGFSEGIDPRQIEILRDDQTNEPYVILHKNAKLHMAKLKYNHIEISLSHCKAYATAMVLIH